MRKAFVVAGLAVSLLVGCGAEETVTERFEIISIEGQDVRGELVEGTGEGIFYTIHQLEEAGLDEVEKGQVVDITWTAESYENEQWDDFAAEEVE